MDVDAIGRQLRTGAEVRQTCRIKALPAAVDGAVVIPSASSYCRTGAPIKQFAIRSNQAHGHSVKGALKGPEISTSARHPQGLTVATPDCGEFLMPTYRIYTIGRDGTFLGAPEVAECADDEKVFARAMQTANGFGVEISDNKRLVAQLPVDRPKA